MIDILVIFGITRNLANMITITRIEEDFPENISVAVASGSRVLRILVTRLLTVRRSIRRTIKTPNNLYTIANYYKEVYTIISCLIYSICIYQ